MKRIVIQRIVSLVLVSLMAMSMAACIIKDATACCSQGIEYVLTEDLPVRRTIRRTARS